MRIFAFSNEPFAKSIVIAPSALVLGGYKSAACEVVGGSCREALMNSIIYLVGLVVVVLFVLSLLGLR